MIEKSTIWSLARLHIVTETNKIYYIMYWISKGF